MLSKKSIAKVCFTTQSIKQNNQPNRDMSLRKNFSYTIGLASINLEGKKATSMPGIQ
jgi:hypothetical protein